MAEWRIYPVYFACQA